MGMSRMVNWCQLDAILRLCKVADAFANTSTFRWKIKHEEVAILQGFHTFHSYSHIASFDRHLPWTMKLYEGSRSMAKLLFQ